MTDAMLWYDASDRPLAERVREAADRYRQKHGREATMCYCHRDEELPESGEVAGVRTERRGWVLLGHLQLNAEDVAGS